MLRSSLSLTGVQSWNVEQPYLVYYVAYFPSYCTYAFVYSVCINRHSILSFRIRMADSGQSRYLPAPQFVIMPHETLLLSN
jgi:hypothetical protein